MTLALCPWKPVEGLLYEKELLPVGPVTKWVTGDKSVIETDISLSFIERVVTNFKKFKDVKVRVPLFKSHVMDPDNDRGTIEDVFIRKNPAGVDSLYGQIRFSSEEYASMGKNVDVSVGCPPKFVDGKGNAYEFPLRHVALTSIPVVPGLEPFRPLVFSHDADAENEMGLMLAEENLETVDPEVDGEAEVDALSELDALILIAQLVDADLAAGNQAIVDAVALKLGGEEAPFEEELEEEFAASHDVVETPMAKLGARAIDQLINARKAEIAGLVSQSVISPALAQKWQERFTTPAAIEFDFSGTQEGSTFFEDAVAMAHELAKDKPITKTQRPVIALSQDATEPATIRDAKRRAAAAKHKA